jgi:hypothetical protein
VVQQISILGGKIFRSGLGIVGAENRRDLGMVGKDLGNALYGIRRDHNIGVHEEDDIPVRVSYPIVSRRSRSRVFRKP